MTTDAFAAKLQAPDPDRTPYQDGLDAAWRHGKYEGATDIPRNPHAPESPEHEQWECGYGDGSDDYWELWKLGEV